MKRAVIPKNKLLCLKQAETCTGIEEVCRQMGISEAKFYNWKKEFGGMGFIELRPSPSILLLCL